MHVARCSSGKEQGSSWPTPDPPRSPVTPKSLGSKPVFRKQTNEKSGSSCLTPEQAVLWKQAILPHPRVFLLFPSPSFQEVPAVACVASVCPSCISLTLLYSRPDFVEHSWLTSPREKSHRLKMSSSLGAQLLSHLKKKKKKEPFNEPL